jgi:hypothetical protein
MYSSRTLLCKTWIPRPTPRDECQSMKIPGLHIRGFRFMLPQPGSLIILGLCFYVVFSYFPDNDKLSFSYECFVGDILWTLNVGDILWQHVIHDICEHRVTNVAGLISQYWLILFALLPLRLLVKSCTGLLWLNSKPKHVAVGSL